MRTALAIPLILISVLIVTGCITQQSFPPTKAETLAGTQQFDLDKDGVPEFTVYDFAPIRQDNVTITRQVVAVARPSATYSSFKNVTDLALLEMRAKLDAFSSNERTALEVCAANAGLKKDCTDTVTCSVLCSGSFKCNRVLGSYQTVVAASMVDFVNDRNVLDGLLVEEQNNMLTLKVASPDQKNAYLQKLLEMKTALAKVYANPLYTRQEIILCTYPDIDLSGFSEVAKGIGTFAPEISQYDYLVTLGVSGGQEGEQISGVEMADWIPAEFVQKEEDIRSNHRIGVTKNASNYVVSWNSERSSQSGYIFYYRFYSAENPERVVQSLYSPRLIVNRVNLGALTSMDWLFGSVLSLSKNFFIALGASLAITIIMALVLYNLLVILFYIVKSRIGKGTALAGVRQALGKTELHWKTDAIVGLILFGAGYYISLFVATTEGTPISLFAALDYFANLAPSMGAAAGLAGSSCIFLGVILFYTAIENGIKIRVLERAYGVVIKEEKDFFLTKVARLKGKINDLQKLVDECTAEEFDVSDEYDALSSISAQRIDDISKETTRESKNAIEKNLMNIENAIERLNERKKMAAENWPKWEETVEKLLTEGNEVYLTALITIPASMRPWVLNKYAKERGGEGVIFERDSLKRKTTTPDILIKTMIKDGLIMGAVVIQKDALSSAHMAQGSATVPSVLTLKLRNYLRSLAKSLGQSEPTSFAVVGEETVQVLLKEQNLESMLLMKREKFKEAIDEWKKKSKLFTGS